MTKRQGVFLAAIVAIAITAAGTSKALDFVNLAVQQMVVASTAAALKMADAVAARSAPTTSAQHSTKNEGTSTTTESGHAIEPDEFTKRLTQNFRIQNLDATDAVCVGISQRANSSETCANECAYAAGTLTCTAADGDTVGARINPSSTYTIAITGEDCLCVEASANTPVINIEQVNRIP